MATGIYRDGSWANVRYEEKYDVLISRAQYESYGHLPWFETLPTKDEYDRAASGVILLHNSEFASSQVAEQS